MAPPLSHTPISCFSIIHYLRLCDRLWLDNPNNCPPLLPPKKETKAPLDRIIVMQFLSVVTPKGYGEPLHINMFQVSLHDSPGIQFHLSRNHVFPNFLGPKLILPCPSLIPKKHLTQWKLRFLSFPFMQKTPFLFPYMIQWLQPFISKRPIFFYCQRSYHRKVYPLPF